MALIYHIHRISQALEAEQRTRAEIISLHLEKAFRFQLLWLNVLKCQRKAFISGMEENLMVGGTF